MPASSHTPQPRPKRKQLAGDLEAIARRVIARDRGEPLAGPYCLSPITFEADRDLCLGAQRRLEGLLRDCSAFNRERAAHSHGGGASAILSAALNVLAEQVATMDYSDASIVSVAEAERATGPLDASAAVTAVLDRCGASTESVEAFLTKLVSTMKERPSSCRCSHPRPSCRRAPTPPPPKRRPKDEWHDALHRADRYSVRRPHRPPPQVPLRPGRGSITPVEGILMAMTTATAFVMNDATTTCPAAQPAPLTPAPSSITVKRNERPDQAIQVRSAGP